MILDGFAKHFVPFFRQLYQNLQFIFAFYPFSGRNIYEIIVKFGHPY